jgi:glycine dehydrogenase subunit 1
VDSVERCSTKFKVVEHADLPGLPPATQEAEITRLMHARAEQDGRFRTFIGAGAYEHHIPAAVWQIATRGEFYSSYTPYQAEASQGTLQVLYEYQSMMTALTALDVTNASLYDGASALAEAVLMAVRAHKSSRRVLLPRSVHPRYRKVVRSIVKNQGIEVLEIPYDPRSVRRPAVLAHLDRAKLRWQSSAQFFGVLSRSMRLPTGRAARLDRYRSGESVESGHAETAGRWGQQGGHRCRRRTAAQVRYRGGPYYGSWPAARSWCASCRTYRRAQRLVAGFTLTLQAREQHIRRSKATSNICTNQGLMVTASTIHMALLGPEGLRRAAQACHAGLMMLLGNLSAIAGVSRAFEGPVFHESV